ncbi:glycoside hydrolase [archaeon]|nr:MAG: glycoside hydrolase [archaeon]
MALGIIFFLAFLAYASALGDGVNLQPSYYNNGDVTFGWDLMKKYPDITTVRIEIEPDKASQAWNWINQASINGYHVIATYHKCSVLGTDNVDELQKAAQWWVQHYDYLSSAGSFTLNLMNEWGSHHQTPDKFANAYNSAIATVRKVYSGSVIVDIPGWGQETQTAANASPKIKDDHVIFSAHVYPHGWNEAAGHNMNADDMNVLAKSGRTCIVGEFGYHDGEGPVNVKAVVQRAKSLGFKVLAWAWNGDGNSYNMVQPTWLIDPKASSYSEHLAH